MEIRLEEILERVKGLRVLVVGDSMLDHYIWGDATRISPEAPVPVVAVARDSFVAGGAANVALNLRALGARAEVCGLVGEDTDGERLRHLLAEADVAFDRALFQREGVTTIVKTRVVVRAQQLCRLDREAARDSYSLETHDLCAALIDKAKNADAVILSDYAKGTLTSSFVQKLIEGVRATDTLVAIDPKPTRRLDFTGVGLMTPNRRESLLMAGMADDDYEEFPAAEVCRRIWEKHQAENLVVTLGAQGMLLSKKGEVLRRMPTYAREVFDVSGAGDTSIAALSLALAGGVGLEDAAHFANTAAGVVVGKVGTAVAHPDELLRFEAAQG